MQYEALDQNHHNHERGKVRHAGATDPGSFARRYLETATSMDKEVNFALCVTVVLGTGSSTREHHSCWYRGPVTVRTYRVL